MKKLFFVILNILSIQSFAASCLSETEIQKSKQVIKRVVDKFLSSEKNFKDYTLNFNVNRCDTKRLQGEEILISLKHNNGREKKPLELSYKLDRQISKNHYDSFQVNDTKYFVSFNPSSPLLKTIAKSEGSNIYDLNNVVANEFKLLMKSLNLSDADIAIGNRVQETNKRNALIDEKIVRDGQSYIKLEKVSPNFQYDYFLLNDQNSAFDTNKIFIDYDKKFKADKENRKSYISHIYDSAGRLDQRDVDVLNKGYLDLLGFFKKDLDEEIQNDIEEAVKEAIKDSEEKSFKILELISFDHNLTSHFLGFEHVEGNKIQIVFPVGEDDGLYIKLKIRAKIDTKYLRKTTNITLTIKGLKISDFTHIALKPSGKIDIEFPEETVVNGSVDIDFSNDVLDFIIDSVEAIFDPLTKKMKEEISLSVTEKVQEELAYMKVRADEVYAKDAAVDLPKSQFVEAKDVIVENIEKKIFNYNLSETVIETPVMSEPDLRRWVDFKDFELESLPPTLKTEAHEDGAIWTGTLLTSMALKYSYTNTSSDELKIKELLRRIEILATINGKGPLARAAFPEDSKNIKKYLDGERGGVFRSKNINGKKWYSIQGEDGISRDQYVGIMTGLINTYFLSNNEEIKKQSKAIYKHLYDYLLDNKWMIFEDSNREVTWSKSKFPTAFMGAGYQKVTYSIAAKKMFPENERYRKEYFTNLPLVKTMWLTAMTSAIEPWEKYYSLNLQHTVLFTLANIVDESDILKHVGNSIKMLDYYIGHHNNAYFDLIRVFAGQKIGLPLNYEKLSSSILESYNSVFYRPQNANAASEEEKAIAKSIHKSGFETTHGRTVNIATFVPTPRYRFNEENFLWQRAPFETINIALDRTEPNTNTTGLDVHIAHWLLKAIGL